MTVEDQMDAVDEAYLCQIKSLYEVVVTSVSSRDEPDEIQAAMKRFYKGLLVARKVRAGILEILSQSMEIED